MPGKQLLDSGSFRVSKWAGPCRVGSGKRDSKGRAGRSLGGVGGQGRLLEEGIQDCFEVQSRL